MRSVCSGSTRRSSRRSKESISAALCRACRSKPVVARLYGGDVLRQRRSPLRPSGNIAAAVLP